MKAMTIIAVLLGLLGLAGCGSGEAESRVPGSGVRRGGGLE